MTAEKIAELNSKCSTSEQGIYFQPYGISTRIKEHVIYKRWEGHGYAGGNCWNDNVPEYYAGEEEPNFEILDLVLKELKPDITYLQFKEIGKLAHENEEYREECYGNSSSYKIKYIILSELENFLNNLK